MADRTLAHSAQNAITTEKMHLPLSAAPVNHGKTVAAWFTTYAVIRILPDRRAWGWRSRSRGCSGSASA